MVLTVHLKFYGASVTTTKYSKHVSQHVVRRVVFGILHAEEKVYRIHIHNTSLLCFFTCKNATAWKQN